ncbi:NDR1/HIN1-like protein 2 [Prunus yedoensis var. nudiflora]|uniref:NDR1/HIN1-like protein 2 n=1 Tax=Prunus yedoensis var. nudiflora TaxID=2094558 RepID=A0A314U5B3_PRUYE|nr:NDR1/HIN1-like protein 2 [Prunus yedoensis var. nudiflora]
MTDRVYPSSKPTTMAAPPCPPSLIPAATANPSHQAQPGNIRPQPQYNRRTQEQLPLQLLLLLLLVHPHHLSLASLTAIAGAAVYILYRPHRPEFTLTSVRIAKLNLTTSSDLSTSHLTTLFNLTLSTKNPNNHLTFSYEPFALSLSSSDVQIGNGSIPAFTSGTKNSTFFRSILSTSQDLDVESVKSLRSDLRKKTGVALKLQMDTKVKVAMGKLKSKKVGIRVTCEGIKGAVPKGKSPSVASVANSKCKVDLRIKIWKWTF